MRGVSLFSGCGGSDLGAKYAGVEVIFANDKYPPSAQTYQKYKDLIASDGVDFHNKDIREITSFPACDILIGCYPCQSFTMGGHRSPEKDERTNLYKEFLRCLSQTQPQFFVVENVAGMQILEGGRYLHEQITAFQTAGKGYIISKKLLDAKDYGVPADRKRLFIIGVRRDVGLSYCFPTPTHGPSSPTNQPYVSHGEAIKHLPIDCHGEYYSSPSTPFSWWFLSRNRKRAWDAPGFTVVSNWRHITLHPASPTMRMVESNWRDGSKQKWEFTQEYDHLDGVHDHPKLEIPRRLSWRECAVLQTFPYGFEPMGNTEAKFWQIGNAVPPLLMKHIISQITTEVGLDIKPSPDYVGVQ